MSDANAAELQPGSTFGAYRIERLIGSGGMGKVFEATHLSLGKRVAIKTILPEHAKNEVVVARFLREAQATARIRHPNVVDVTDVGTSGGTPYLVMELLEGSSLRTYIIRVGWLDVTELVDLMVPLLLALFAVHEAGIVHRDIKPDNIFVATIRGGVRPVLVDFGISKWMDGAGSALTKTSTAMGTPLYMAPEQLEDSRNIDGRVDVYAIAIVIYEMLCGAAPFAADSMASLLLSISRGEYIPLAQKRPELDPAFVAVITRAMAFRRDDRFATAAEFARALLPFASPSVRTLYEKELRQTRRIPEPAQTATSVPPSPKTAVWMASAPPASSAAAQQASAALDAPKGPQLSPMRARVPLVLIAGVIAFASALVGGVGFVVWHKRAELFVAGAAEGSRLGAAVAQASSAGSTDEAAKPSSIDDANRESLRGLHFSGDCTLTFDGVVSVDGNAQTITIFSAVPGRPTGNVINVLACSHALGRYNLGTWADHSLAVQQGARSWMSIEGSRGSVNLRSIDCTNARVDVTFEGVVLSDMNHTSECRLDGTLRLEGRSP